MPYAAEVEKTLQAMLRARTWPMLSCRMWRKGFPSGIIEQTLSFSHVTSPVQVDAKSIVRFATVAARKLRKLGRIFRHPC